VIVGHEARPARIDILVSPTVAMKTPSVVLLRTRMTPVGRHSARKTRQERTPWRPTHFDTLARTVADRAVACAQVGGRRRRVACRHRTRPVTMARRTSSAPSASSTWGAAPSSATTPEWAPAGPTLRCEGTDRRAGCLLLEPERQLRLCCDCAPIPHASGTVPTE
jgi:hypothetical protein